jgi:two-component system, OmpR family, alkaline phosphatase synthesis response regulator PhoP
LKNKIKAVDNKIIVLEDDHKWYSTVRSGRYESKANFTSSKAFLDKLVIDKSAYTVYIGGKKILFPKKEFELLLLLADKPGKVFKRSEILQIVWGIEYKYQHSRSLDVHIRMLRKKLNNNYISTVRGVGYKLEK